MKTLVAFLSFFFSFQLFAFAQIDAIESLFEKEAPEFQVNTTVLEDGKLELEVYYTHSRVNTLEVSFWQVDRGDSRLNQGEKSLIGQLQKLSNRQSTTLVVEGMTHEHFYGFGVDYRRPSNINLVTKPFKSKLLLEGYQYQSISQPIAKTPPATMETPKANHQEFVSRNTENQVANDCVNPKIRLNYKSSGYCQDGEMPALIIQNSVEQNWEFTIERRASFGYWQSIYGEGKRLKAKGSITRTEPLCLLTDGSHELRVLAWGEGCATPVVKVLREQILVGNGGVASAPTAKTEAKEEAPSQYNFLAKSPKKTPDTCLVRGDATLTGNIISGYVQLDKSSPCGTWSPYAMIRYVHPGHRDIVLEPVRLELGEKVEFTMKLDEYDLDRTIHPINVLTYIHENRSTSDDQVVSAFWIRPENRNMDASLSVNTPPAPPAINRNTTTSNEDFASTNSAIPTQSVAPKVKYVAPSTTTEKSINSTNQPPSYDEYAMTEEVKTVNVTATDPNCTQVHDLQLVYDLQRSKQPLYISWLSPRCCQEGGCEYTIWAGEKPDELSLVMKGYKAGSKIQELLNPSQSKATYYEVVVKTSNGNRKAAYVVGEGAKYGVEEILDYHDRFNAPKSDALMIKETTSKSGKASTASFQWDETDGELYTESSAYNYQQPELPISDFSTCKYTNDIRLIGDHPIHVGDEITIKSNYNRPGYVFTLYQRPEGREDWVIAPGTRELQEKPTFTIKAGKYHSGNYMILLHKEDKNWGCLSKELSASLEIEVLE
ncbi:MAG: hypothetical protein AAGG68_09480 [Bacteroidota bacterium]